ncbi:hypothetical protein MLD38_022854 [Melastoma candidum]|uniref:Uncharacterized protein n=1 Tax=Melastoma candidum TaxID=119954 RepID=A0ACB9QLU3_9MYRT|nr:hypothetical protein MLD38_022854 [Melastoma candidum]
MEDSFKVRVDRIFGALAVPSSAAADASASSLSSTVSPMNSMWSLTDHEIQRKEWKRDKRDPELDQEVEEGEEDGEAGFDMAQDLDELDDEGEVEPRGESPPLVKPDEYNDEEWEIRSAIGRDCTLDYEVWLIFVVSSFFSVVLWHW